MFKPNETEKGYINRRLYHQKSTNTYYIKIDGHKREICGYNDDDTVYI